MTQHILQRLKVKRLFELLSHFFKSHHQGIDDIQDDPGIDQGTRMPKKGE